MADMVRQWSDELARDPSSRVFLPLAETLRQQGQLDLARRVAVRGLQRHPHDADAHDALARIHVDSGELQQAFDEWDMVLRLKPGHVGAMKGMAYIRFQQGRLDEAEALLVKAQAEGDGEVSGALANVRASGSMRRMSLSTAALEMDPRQMFADLLPEGHSAIMLDGDGLVMAGAHLTRDGSDVAGEIGATLSGTSGEAERATRHLDIGSWRSITFETEEAVVTLAPNPAVLADRGGVLLVIAPPASPLGLLRRILGRCLDRAASLAAGGAQ